jgi:hypothetical protein
MPFIHCESRFARMHRPIAAFFLILDQAAD